MPFAPCGQRRNGGDHGHAGKLAGRGEYGEWLRDCPLIAELDGRPIAAALVVDLPPWDDVSDLVFVIELFTDLLGFSTGGRAAVELVRRFPRDVRRLILASTSAYPAGDAERYLRDRREPRRRHAMEDAAAGTRRNSTVFVWNLDLAPAYLALIEGLDEGDWSHERWLTGQMHPWVNGGPEQILFEFGGRRVLILHGDKDMRLRVQLAERLNHALPGSELAIIKDAAHMCQFEDPSAWSDQIRSFVDRH